MQNPTDPAEASIPTETVRESPNLNQYPTFTVRRKAAKRSERWYQTTATPLPPPPQAEFIPARKKRRLDEPRLTATDEAATKNRSHATTVARPPNDHAATTTDSDHSVMGMHPKAKTTCTWKSRKWTPEEDVKLTSAFANTRKKKLAQEYLIDWVAIATLIPGRTNLQCAQRWRNVLDPNSTPTAGRKRTWTADEDVKLKNSVQLHGGKDWKAIAVLVPGRSKCQCKMRWYSAFHLSNIALTTGRTGKWTADEDSKLKVAVQMHGGKDWKAIATLVLTRTESQCCRRWHDALDPSIALTAGRTGRWTADEDSKLKGAVQMHGDKNWVVMAALVPGRTKFQCCRRWRDVLDPSIALTAGRTGKWTADEVIKLKGAVQTHGSSKSWDEISALVQGRTKLQCYHRWHAYQI
jgi:uncharacterized protein (DUF2237 family)